MNQLFKNIIRGGLVAFAVGAALAALAPIIGGAMGLSATTLGLSANPLWIGAYFGTWGALSAVAEPISNWIFGDKQKSQGCEMKEAPSQTKQVKLMIIAPQHTQQPENTTQNLESVVFRQKIQAERIFLPANEKTLN